MEQIWLVISTLLKTEILQISKTTYYKNTAIFAHPGQKSASCFTPSGTAMNLGK